ncbi:MAG: T9SS type A sorting domain-containing protein [Flavobacteriales bacterium]
MKNITTLLFAYVTLSVAANAQCTFIMSNPSPGNVKITTDQTLNAAGVNYWICDGVNVIISSSLGSSFFLEANATITFNGASSTNADGVFAKAGCVITNNSIGNILVTVNPTNVTLVNNGTGGIILNLSCPSIIYDYTWVGGSSGCATEITEEEEKKDIRIYPNPAIDKINFSETFTGEYRIYDFTGNLVKKETVSGVNQISVDYLSMGAYALFLNDKEYWFVK